MNAPVRFLLVTVGGWAAYRAISYAVGSAPLASVPLPPPPTTPLAELAPAPVAASTAVPAPPIPAAMPAPVPPTAYAAAMPGAYYYPAVAISRPVAQPASGPLLPARWSAAALLSDAPVPQSEAFPFARTIPTTRTDAGVLAAAAAAAASPSPLQSAPALPARGYDRWSLSAWGLFRQQSTAAPSLAAGGTLGGSQAGARLAYQVRRGLSVTARFSAPGDQTGLAGEGAVGIAYQPFRSIPVRLLAERRQRLGRLSTGRNAWALLAEGGVYDHPMPYGTRLNAYVQGGVVGARRRDLFVDGGATLTHPFRERFAVGAGAWGGTQPGLSRLDVGPRVSMRWRRNIAIHVDYRYRLLGKAAPGSGPAVTIGADF
ncbi:hypothetical protein HMF7854_01870 [Sphingomonas ginkgonis]|uniref:Uncharacterized protein n=1 Tax=Sphingomonas ginkgonis TaxID=2315330 RepID=A0A429V735_9SPHN|nr:hypothetical protein [Sphingomonas ginkgonis]RST29712.1 hypothetical protein HMF7854_01870 [Sphingomonas ginkgonis]